MSLKITKLHVIKVSILQITFTGLEKSKPLSSLVTAQVLTLLLTTHNYMDGPNNMTKIIYLAHFVSDHCSLRLFDLESQKIYNIHVNKIV